MLVAANALISVTPGLMIWTIVCFLIALFVLKRYAFGPIQQMIDERRARIRAAIDEADRARNEARQLLEEHRKLIASARHDAENVRLAAPAETRRQVLILLDRAARPSAWTDEGLPVVSIAMSAASRASGRSGAVAL